MALKKCSSCRPTKPTSISDLSENLKGSVPTEKNARDYFINTQLWSANDNIPVFYFSSFDIFFDQNLVIVLKGIGDCW